MARLGKRRLGPGPEPNPVVLGLGFRLLELLFLLIKSSRDTSRFDIICTTNGMKIEIWMRVMKFGEKGF